MKFAAIFLLVFLVSHNAFSKTFDTSERHFKSELEEHIVYDSNVLNYFWSGDDGIECGEPEIDKLVVDYKSLLITFDVYPKGVHPSCERRPMTCEIEFVKMGASSIEIEDKEVGPYGQGCSF